MISLDVVTLFTNVPIDLAIESLDEIYRKHPEIGEKFTIPWKDMINLIKLCMSSSVFQFEDKFYEQHHGAPMGSPLSPVLANAAMDKLERELVPGFGEKVLIWTRYVDDIFAIVDSEHIQTILSSINSYRERISFTVEVERGDAFRILTCS